MSPIVYTKEQLDLVRILVETENCSVTELVSVTGIPRGSVRAVARRAGSRIPAIRKPGKSRLKKILETKKINDLRTKYARELEEHFANTKPAE